MAHVPPGYPYPPTGPGVPPGPAGPHGTAPYPGPVGPPPGLAGPPPAHPQAGMPYPGVPGHPGPVPGRAPYHPQAGAPQPYRPAPRKSSKAPLILGLTAVLVVMLAVVGFVFVSARGAEADASEVDLQGNTEVGPDPFTPSVANPPAGDAGASGSSTTVKAAAATTQPTTPPASAGAQRTYTGSQPGIYGGTRDIATCDAKQMLDYLDQNPDKKRAWAGVQGISVSEVRSFVGRLTPVILRTDTYVTNHGYANGQATSIPTVLQAGTAVLVDQYGIPRVKCSCGNPLTEFVRPRSTASRPWRPHYRGTRWSWFRPETVVIIQKTTVVINTFILIDIRTNVAFSRTPGITVRDTDAPGNTAPPAPSAPESTPPSTEAPTTAPPAPPSTEPPTDYGLPETPDPLPPAPEPQVPHQPVPQQPQIPTHTAPQQPQMPTHTVPQQPQMPTHTVPQQPQMPQHPVPQQPQMPTHTAPPASTPPGGDEPGITVPHIDGPLVPPCPNCEF